ncbi:MAG TPA: hypothetical protein VEX88_15700 [Glaciibacter sp.]|nr:hypothetical protein [Glaciibacter sp.]
MPEIEEDLPVNVRERRPDARRRRGRIALVLAGAGLTASIIAGAALGSSATAGGVAEAGHANPAPAEPTASAEPPAPTEPTASAEFIEKSQSESATDVITESAADVTDATGSATSEAPEADTEAEAVAPEDAEPIRYDASTDIATIPRPPAEWPADQLANAEVWLTQQSIIADCMLEKGFEYVFVPYWTFPDKYTPGNENWDGDFSSPKGIALDGEPDRGLGDDYDWKEAGCHGYAVHVTGMDNAN